MSDLIERDRVIAVIDRCRHRLQGQGSTYEIMLDMMKAIPSARPKGEWVDAEIPLESGDTMPIQVCNLCKTFYPLAYTGGGHRFCPNCGAKMKGEDDERKDIQSTDE